MFLGVRGGPCATATQVPRARAAGSAGPRRSMHPSGLNSTDQNPVTWPHLTARDPRGTQPSSAPRGGVHVETGCPSGNGGCPFLSEGPTAPGGAALGEHADRTWHPCCEPSISSPAALLRLLRDLPPCVVCSPKDRPPEGRGPACISSAANSRCYVC